MIATQNHGPLIASSTYWSSEHARRGYYYMSPNAGTLRLLCPPGRSGDICEMVTARNVVLTVGVVREVVMPGMQLGREMTEVLFDDGSEQPFLLYLSQEQWERMPGNTDYGSVYEFTVWEDRCGTPHKIMSRPVHLRRGALPCMQPAPKA